MFMHVILFLLCLVADRFSKFLVLTRLTDEVILTPFLNFSLVWNKGISWGMLSFSEPSSYMMLTFLIIFVTLLFFFYTISEYRRGHAILFETVVLAGAVSNVMDRFLYGAVVDFIELHAGNWYWPTFNIADVFIVIGVIGICLRHWFGDKDVFQN